MTACAVLESAATRTVFLCPEVEGTVRGAPHGAVSVLSDITNFAIMPYHKTRKTPGNVSRVIVRIRYQTAEPPIQAAQARPRATFHRERKLYSKALGLRRRLPLTRIMPPVASEPPDTEVLDGTPFKSGGWPDGSISFDAGFSQVAEALGDGAPLESATPETLLAVAFSEGDSSRLLKSHQLSSLASGSQ